MTYINEKLRFAVLEKKRRNSLGREKALQAEVIDTIRRELRASRCRFPPTDLKGLARHLGVTSIREVPLAMRGRVLMDESEVVIELNEQLEPAKKKFTLAHELAHLILERERAQSSTDQGSAARRDDDLSYNRIEDLCDLAAAEMLLPSDWFQRRTLGLPASLALVRDVAHETECPITIVAGRAVDAWDCRFLWWRFLNGEFQVVKSIPHENKERLALYLPIGSNSVIGRSLSEKNSILRDHCLISNGIVEDKYDTECMALERDVVLAMVRFGRRGRRHQTFREK